MDISLILLALAHVVSSGHAVLHETTMFYGCSESGDGQVQLHWDGDQIIYADFKNHQSVWTAPLLEELKKDMSSGFYVLALVSRERACKQYLAKAVQVETSPMAEKAPTVLIYPMEEVEEGKENTFYCYMRHLYPPSVNVTWTRNGVQVTDNVTLSNFYPEMDGTFSLLASLSLQPELGDVLHCSVQHQALSQPTVKAWELPEKPTGSISAWVCLSVGLVCFTLGVVVFIIASRISLPGSLSDSLQAAYDTIST